MRPAIFLTTALEPALSLLPVRMDSSAARALIVAIALQESRIEARRQRRGPARGYAQFEKAGVAGVLTHPASGPHAVGVCTMLDIKPTAAAVHAALEFHDVLTCVFARLLLWTLPNALPGPTYFEESWRQYRAAWAPGKPRPETWAANYLAAWKLVGEE